MNNKYRIVSGVAMVLAAVLATGCQHKRGCVNGSCAAPSYGTPSYGSQNFGASPVSNGAGYGSVNTYSDSGQSYSAPTSGGSGTRSAPIMQGSGSR